MKVRAGREGANLTIGKSVYMVDDLSPLTEAIANIEGSILFFNIGYPLASGDAFGPILGTMLRRRNANRYGVYVMETEKRFIGSRTLPQKIEEAKRRYSHCTVVATDAAFGDRIGRYSWEKGMLMPGVGAKKNLPPIGDYSLMVCVLENNSWDDSWSAAQRLVCKSRWEVENYAHRACDAIMEGLKIRHRSSRKLAVKGA